MHINSKNQMVFHIDENVENTQAFETAVQYFKKNSNIKIVDSYITIWDTNYFKFEMENIYVELYFVDAFLGTYLTISANSSEKEVFKVTQWCEDIRKIIKRGNN